MDMKTLRGFLPYFALLILTLLLALSCGSGSGGDDDSGESPTNDDDDSAEDDDDDSQADDDDDDDDDTSDDDDNDDDDESDDDDDSSDDDDDDTHQPLQCSGGMCLDPESGLTWIQAPPTDGIDWQGAKDYCQTLSFGGYDNWKLPSISELRTLIRGCNKTETGGECPLTDSCNDFGVCYDQACDGCGNGQGEGTDGMYFPVGIAWAYDVDISNAFWSTIEEIDPDSDEVLQVDFYSARVGLSTQDNTNLHAICVRY